MDTPPSHLLSLSSSDRSQTVSPIRLASPSSVTPARPDASHSPYSSGNLTAAAAGLGVASLTFDSIRAAEMNELLAQLRDELRHDPFRVSALSFSNLRGGGRVSRPLKRVNLPICINSLRDAHGHDISHYLCDTENFRADCAMQGLQEEDALVLIPDENDAFSYNQLLTQLRELHDGVESHPVAAFHFHEYF